MPSQIVIPENLVVKSVPISAVGKALSAENAGRIRDAWQALNSLLIEHKIIDASETGTAETSIESVDPEEVSTSADKPKRDTKIAVEASSTTKLLDSFQRTTWCDNVRTAVRLFGYRFQDMLRDPEDKSSTKAVGKAVDELVEEFRDLLNQLVTSAPEPETRSGSHGVGGYGYGYGYDYYDSMELSAKEGSEKSKDSQLLDIAAGEQSDFKSTIDNLSWSNRLSTTLRVFTGRFMDLVMSDQSKEANAIPNLITDLLDLIDQLRKDYPAAGEERINRPFAHLSLAAAAAGAEISEYNLEFSATQIVVASSEQASNPEDMNRHPIEGVLFRIDEPSECAPSVGPGLPLLIPREVAEAAISQVSGLPLDAHDTLSQHANEDIAGVMLSASIADNDFCIKGFLWPWSRTDKVAAICAAKDKLGMSMNGAAAGHETDHNGRKVFRITQLVLLGANILYADRATYQQTRIISAEAQPGTVETTAEPASDEDLLTDENEELMTESDWLALSAEGVAEMLGLSDDEPTDDDDLTNEVEPSIEAIAAEADLPYTGEETTSQISQELTGDDMAKTAMDLIQAELSDISQTVGGLEEMKSEVANLTSLVRAQQETIIQLQAQIGVLEEEREEKTAEIQASSARQQQEEQQKHLISLIQETIASTINPSGEPSRRTFSAAARQTATEIQAGAGGSVNERIAHLQGQLQALDGVPNTGSKRMQLKDEIRGLQALA